VGERPARTGGPPSPRDPLRAAGECQSPPQTSQDGSAAAPGRLDAGQQLTTHIPGETYERRASAEWLADLAPLGTDWRKPFLEIAPYLIVVFIIDYEPEGLADGTERPHNNYYVQESVGIAVGVLLTALHTAGRATLTHTPGWLSRINPPINPRAVLRTSPARPSC
jgi:hypothetical protein